MRNVHILWPSNEVDIDGDISKGRKQVGKLCLISFRLKSIFIYIWIYRGKCSKDAHPNVNSWGTGDTLLLIAYSSITLGFF